MVLITQLQQMICSLHGSKIHMITSQHIPHHTKESGIALFVAVIFASVVLLIGLTMASFGYKQVILSSLAVASQKAYYAADSAMECALYADQQQSAFAPNISVGSIYCGSTNNFSEITTSGYRKYTINNIKSINPDVCADVVIYKETIYPYITYIFSTGYYNVGQSSCSVNTHTTIKGISIKYGS